MLDCSITLYACTEHCAKLPAFKLTSSAQLTLLHIFHSFERHSDCLFLVLETKYISVAALPWLIWI